ncbi:MAG: hypothetical protein ACOX2W_13720 [Desulfomonilia bacterium]
MGHSAALRVRGGQPVLNVKVCAVVDSDIRSITSDWIQYLLEPVLKRDYQFVGPGLHAAQI